MVLLNTKQESSSVSSPLNIAPQDEKETALSFSALLKGIGSIEKEDTQTIQNGSLLLSLVDEKVSAKSLTLDELPLELNPKVTQNITPTELKVVIQQAKQYIKSKIITSESLSKQDIKSLPKTLKGLVQVAQKIGLDISKITLEEVQQQDKISQIPALKVKPEVKRETKTEPKLEMSQRSVSERKAKVDKEPEQKVQREEKLDTQVYNTQKKKINTPLFKAQTAKEITTQEIVNVKAMQVTPKTVKQTTKNTLELLLRGEKVVKQDTNLTADFSVAASRVIAPSEKTELNKSLESLLQNSDTQESQTQSKTDGLNVAKADSFEVKLNEAKQMVKYLSADVKSAIEDYKSPFTRVKVQLSPQKLGEVDVTIVQRGKNLHVNLSSNNAAINTLALNANDLKVQLNNNGINNATLNFSNNAQAQDGSASQQQNHQQRQEAQESYNFFESEEIKEEIISSLEIIVPHYA